MVFYSFYLDRDKKKESLVYRTDGEVGYHELNLNPKLFDSKAEAQSDFFKLLWDNEDYRIGEYFDTNKAVKKVPQKKEKIIKVEQPKVVEVPKPDIRVYTDIKKDFVYNEDCMKTMARMPMGFVDYIITSPPYNVGKRISFGKNNAIYLDNEEMYSEYEDELTTDEYEAWLFGVIDECIRVSRYHVFFNIQMLSKNKRTVLRMMGKYADKIKDIFIWDKTIASPNIRKGIPRSKFEFIVIFSNESPENREFQGVDFSGSFSNVIQGTNAGQNKFSRINKCTFPLYLPKRIIYHFCKRGTIIYDPFNGTGTTAEAAYSENKSYIGSELDPVQCEITNTRIQNELIKIKLDFPTTND